MRSKPPSSKSLKLGSLAFTAVGLVLAAPAAMSQTQQPQQQPQAQPPQGKAGQPEITVQQPPPQITVQQPKPEVTVKQPAPQVTVEQPQPKVDVQQAQPNVKVEQQGEPKIQVQQPGQPTVRTEGQQAQQQGQQGNLAQMGRGIVGKDVYGSNNENIGEVEDIVMGQNNQLQSALVDVGGFLGIGERRVAVPITNLRLEGDRLVSTMTRQQIEQLPEHEDESGRGTTGQSGSRSGGGTSD